MCEALTAGDAGAMGREHLCPPTVLEELAHLSSATRTRVSARHSSPLFVDAVGVQHPKAFQVMKRLPFADVGAHPAFVLHADLAQDTA